MAATKYQDDSCASDANSSAQLLGKPKAWRREQTPKK